MNAANETLLGMVLIDHRSCGGGGCKACKRSGTELVEMSRPALVMPSDEDEFDSAREDCPCFEGIAVNDGVTQCTHADAYDDCCNVDVCPLVAA